MSPYPKSDVERPSTVGTQELSHSTIASDDNARTMAAKLDRMFRPGVWKGLRSPRSIVLYLFMFSIGLNIAVAVCPWNYVQFETPRVHDPRATFYFEYWTLENFGGNCTTANGRFSYDEVPCMPVSSFQKRFQGCAGLINDEKERIQNAVRVSLAATCTMFLTFGFILFWISRPYMKSLLYRLIGLNVLCIVLSIPVPAIFSSENEYFPIRCFRDFLEQNAEFDLEDSDAFTTQLLASFYLSILTCVILTFSVIYLVMEIKTTQSKVSLLSLLQGFEDKMFRLQQVTKASSVQLDSLIYEFQMLESMQDALSAKIGHVTSEEDRARLESELAEVRQSLLESRKRFEAQSAMQDYLATDQAKMLADLSNRIDSFGDCTTKYAALLQEKLTVVDVEIERNYRTQQLNKMQYMEKKMVRLHAANDSNQIEILIQKQQQFTKEAEERERILDGTVNPHLRRFYLLFQSKLNAIFEASRVLSSGLVQRRMNSKTDKAASTIELAGLWIPIPGFHFFAAASGVAFRAYADRREYNQTTQQGELFVSTSQMNELVEEVSFLLVQKWEQELYDLFISSPYWPDDIVVFVEQSIYAILKWIRTQEEASEAFLDNAPSLTTAFVKAASAHVRINADQAELTRKSKKRKG
eukprot:ANDGO_05875.mRNA.1 hypothetical protein